MKKFNLFLVCFLFLFGINNLLAQVTSKRYSFAKSYFGMEIMAYPALEKAYRLETSGQIQKFTGSGALIPSFNIGGTHFWGYADFYVTINLGTINISNQPVERRINYGALTGMRIYPWPLQRQAVRPFIGYKFSPIRLIQNDILDRSYSYTRVKSMFDIGIGYSGKLTYAYLSAGYLPNDKATVYLDRSTSTSSKYPTHWIQAGINIQLETTAGAYTPEIRKMDSLFSLQNMAGLFFGVGPSSAFPTNTSSYITTFHPYLDDRSMPSVFPELSMGYHLSKTDIAFALNIRPLFQNREAFGFKQNIKRISLGAEFFKYLADFHGFAPYIGTGVSGDFISIHEFENGSKLSGVRKWKSTPHLVYGWDIRPSRKADIWLLRTNLRYSPWQKVKKNGKEISLQFNEFNFIQLVVYPQRIKIYRINTRNAHN